MGAITKTQVGAAYHQAILVKSDKEKLSRAVDKLTENFGMNRSSATDSVRNVLHMLEGDLYRRTNNSMATELYLQKIYEDFGRKGLANALASVKAHVDYYYRVRKVKLRRILDLHERFTAVLEGPRKAIRARRNELRRDQIVLDGVETKVRRKLIAVAQGELDTHKSGYISYKELWRTITRKSWNQSRARKIVSWITRVSAFDLQNGRPPLNELVVRINEFVPTEPWSSIKAYLKSQFGVVAPYGSHEEAQEACWKYWAGGEQDGGYEVEEGYRQDRTGRFRNRNARIVERRRELDGYACQACGFKLEVNGRYVIDCHHIRPLALDDSIRVTRIEDLVCLCPTCHRVAHVRRYPLSLDEIRKYLAMAKKRS